MTYDLLYFYASFNSGRWRLAAGPNKKPAISLCKIGKAFLSTCMKWLKSSPNDNP